MKTFVISRKGQALPNRKVVAESRSEAMKKAVAIFGTKWVSAVEI